MNIFRCTPNPQYKPNSEIIIAHTCSSEAVELAKSIVDCALIVEQIGNGEYDKPTVIKNTF